MGQLADDVYELVKLTKPNRNTWAHRVADRVAEIEALAAAAARANEVLRDQLEQVAAGVGRTKLDEISAVARADERAADAEQRAAAAWAAVTNVVVRHMQVMDVVEVRPDADGNAFMTGLGTYSQIGGVNKSILLAVLLPSSPPNPDLLERRGTELIEAGERLLREYAERQVAT